MSFPYLIPLSLLIYQYVADNFFTLIARQAKAQDVAWAVNIERKTMIVQCVYISRIKWSFLEAISGSKITVSPAEQNKM